MSGVMFLVRVYQSCVSRFGFTHQALSPAQKQWVFPIMMCSFPCSMVTDRAKIRLGPMSFWSLSNSSFSQTKVDDYSNLRKDASFYVKPGFGCCSIAITSYVEVFKACSIYGWGLLPSNSSGFSPFSSNFCEWQETYTPFPDTPKSVLEFQSTSQFPWRSTKTHGES